MKKLIAPLILCLMFALSMCTEEVIKIVKETDTLYLPDPCKCIKHDTVVLLRVDSFFVETVKTKTDTVYRVLIDSVFITQTVIEYVHDTVYQTNTDTLFIHHYMDTLVTFESGRPLEVFGEWQDIAIEFYRLSALYGWSESLGGNCIIEMWTADEAPPVNRSAFSYFIYDQYMVKLKESLTHDEAFTPLFREWARRVLGKKYAPEGSGVIMAPDFNPKALRFNDTDAKKKPFLDELFKH